MPLGNRGRKELATTSGAFGWGAQLDIGDDAGCGGRVGICREVAGAHLYRENGIASPLQMERTRD